MISSFSKFGISYILGVGIFALTSSLLLPFILFFTALVIQISTKNKLSFLILTIGCVTGSLHHHFCGLSAPNFENDRYNLKAVKFNVSEVKVNGLYTTLGGELFGNDKKEIPVQINLKNSAHSFSSGEILLIKSIQLQKIVADPFPYKFDFNSFLIQKGFIFKGWLHNENFEVIGIQSGVRPIINSLKTQLKNNLTCKSFQHKAILFGICLGDKSTIEKQNKNLFIKNGIAHIMAVSGLHIGIVFLIFSQLFLLIFRNKKIINTITPILLVWIFILITGAPISALRAGLMISIYGVFKLLNRKNEKLHTIVLTAFIILLTNPKSIMDVGFQLSFLALIGILYFTDFFLKHLKSDYLILHYFGSIIAVSLAVQTTTLPLSIYYFHSFPLHFLLTNIVAIPFAFILLILFMTYLMFSQISALSDFILKTMDLLIDFVLSFLQLFECASFLFLENIHLSESTLISYYFLLILFFAFPMNSIKHLNKIALIVGTCFVTQVMNSKNFEKESFIYSYEDKGLCILVKSGKNIVLLHENPEVKLKYFHPKIRNRMQTIQIEDNCHILVGNENIGFNLSQSLLSSIDKDIRLYYSKELILPKSLKKETRIARKLQRKHPSSKGFLSYQKL